MESCHTVILNPNNIGVFEECIDANRTQPNIFVQNLACPLPQVTGSFFSTAVTSWHAFHLCKHQLCSRIGYSLGQAGYVLHQGSAICCIGVKVIATSNLFVC